MVAVGLAVAVPNGLVSRPFELSASRQLRSRSGRRQHTWLGACSRQELVDSGNVLAKRCCERRQIFLDDFSHDIDINAEVPVREDVPKATNLRLIDLSRPVAPTPKGAA